jgi:hypothetical protein
MGQSRAVTALLVAGSILAGCNREATTASWLTGFDWRWQNSNHRLSSMVVEPVGADIDVAVVGGASTTGVVFNDNGCINAGTCWELPVADAANLSAQWSEVTTSDAVVINARVPLIVALGGAEQTIAVPLPRRFPANTPVTAFLSGLALATGDVVPDPAVSCYDPRHGWLLRELGAGVISAALTGDRRAVDVRVSGAFQAGASLEEERRCLDAAVAGAGIGLDLSVVVVVGGDEGPVTDVAQAAIVPFDPEAPEAFVDDDWTPWTISAGQIGGWTEVYWRFHYDDVDYRGAYLRGLTLAADADAGRAIGWATHDAPSVVLKSGFSFLFSGRLQTWTVDQAPAAHSASIAEMPALVDEAGVAVRTTLSAP